MWPALREKKKLVCPDLACVDIILLVHNSNLLNSSDICCTVNKVLVIGSIKAVYIRCMNDRNLAIQYNLHNRGAFCFLQFRTIGNVQRL